MERRAVWGLIAAAALCTSGPAGAFSMGETTAALGTQGTLNASGGSNAAGFRKSVTDGLAKAAASRSQEPGGKVGGKAGAKAGTKPSSGFGGNKAGKGSWVAGGDLGGKSSGKGSWVGPASKSGGGNSGWASASAKGAAGWATGGGDLGSKSGSSKSR
jgi:hypothetical protein